MKKIWVCIALLPFLCFCDNFELAVTYDQGGERLGDKLVDYMHAKWISYKYGLPFFYRPFDYSDQFVFHEVEEVLTDEKAKNYQIQKVMNLDNLQNPVTGDTLFEIIHCPDSYAEHRVFRWYSPYIAIDWEDQGFRSMIKDLVRPRGSLKIMQPPKGLITVALHYRTGINYDSEYNIAHMKLRFPNDRYYLGQLKHLHKILGREKMHVHIFTDHPNPQEIVDFFQKQMPDTITFSCRTEDNSHTQNVLEDLFSMTQFDCLIRGASHYATTASHIGDFKVEIYPLHCKGKKIDRVEVVQKGMWNPLTKSWDIYK